MSRKTHRSLSWSKLYFPKPTFTYAPHEDKCCLKLKLSLTQYSIFLLWCSAFILTAVLIDCSMLQKSAIRQFFQNLHWTPLPLGVGFALIAYQQYKHTRRREFSKLSQSEACHVLADEWEVQAYKLLPLKSFSRAVGWVTGVNLPEWTRGFLLGSYVKAFSCNMAEAEMEDIHQYKCLSELFRRKLKASARPVDARCPIVSPADGTILHLGKINCGKLEQIKGVSYSLKGFLGPNCWSAGGPIVMDENKDECFHMSCLENPIKNDLFYVAVYLAPGDYHCFHSPADWDVSFRRHFPGELLSVSPTVAAWIQDLFVLNERVSYVGRWQGGFLSMTAVGATNVGSIVVPFDSQLKTNCAGGGGGGVGRRGGASSCVRQSFYDHHFGNGGPVVTKSKGEEFGEFNLGSTVVVIFEAPKGASFAVHPGDKVVVGQGMMLKEL